MITIALSTYTDRIDTFVHDQKTSEATLETLSMSQEIAWGRAIF